MRKYLLLFTTLISFSACATQTAMPLGNNLMQIDVSAAPVYGRAGAQRLALEKAAEATLEAGYDKFIVVSNNGWNESTASGNSTASFQANQYNASGFSQNNWGTFRNPESTMVIRMYHNKDKGAAQAIDAHKYAKK